MITLFTSLWSISRGLRDAAILRIHRTTTTDRSGKNSEWKVWDRSLLTACPTEKNTDKSDTENEFILAIHNAHSYSLSGHMCDQI